MRFPRTSLRLLLVVLAGAAICFWWGTRQHRIAMSLRGQDVQLTYRYQYASWGDAETGTLSTAAILPWYARALGEDIGSTVVSVRSVGARRPGEVLHLAARLPQLRSLTLQLASLADHQIAPLTALTRLRVLDLRGTEITDASVTTLTKLKGLRTLDVRGTNLSRDGIEALSKGLPRTTIHGDAPQGGSMG